MIPSRRIKIRGRKWTIVFGRPPVNRCMAYCDPNICTIWIRPSENRTKQEQRASIIHEILHAAFYDLREEAVEEAAEALVKGLELLD